jgi:hypothetical protein
MARRVGRMAATKATIDEAAKLSKRVSLSTLNTGK